MLELSAAQRLKLYRKYLGMSQAQLAAAMNTTQTTVARWESGGASVTPMAMSHVCALTELKVKEDIQKAFAEFVPQLRLCDYDGLLAYPSSAFTDDQQGNLYLGVIEIMGHREHALYVSVDDGKWYALNRKGEPTKVDTAFLSHLQLRSRLRPGGEIVKDDPGFQRDRIRRIAAEVVPNGSVVFDSAQPFTWIRFRVDDSRTGTILSTSSGHYHVSEVADWTDEKLAAFIRAICPSFAR